MIMKFSAADVESLEGASSVGAVFEQIFFALFKFFALLVFAESVAASAYSCRPNGGNQVLVVGAVKERYKALLTYEPIVDE